MIQARTAARTRERAAMDDGQKFWTDMFKESCEQGWPQPMICIPHYAYEIDAKAIERAARASGFTRMVVTGDMTNEYFCRYV